MTDYSNDQAVYGATCAGCGEPATHVGTYYDPNPRYAGTALGRALCENCAADAVCGKDPPRALRPMDWWTKADALAYREARLRAKNSREPRLPGIDT